MRECAGDEHLASPQFCGECTHLETDDDGAYICTCWEDEISIEQD